MGREVQEWVCSCGQHNTGDFCISCGERRENEASQGTVWRCACGQENDGAFCIGCGQPRPERGGQAARPSVQSITSQPTQSAQSSRTGTNPAVIALLVVIIGLLCFGVGFLLKDSLFAAKTPASSTSSSSSSGTVANTQTTPAPVDDKKLLSSYISDKEQYDREITVLAQDINSYLGQHSDFRSDSSLQSRAQSLCQRIKDERSRLQSEKSKLQNPALQSKLDEVLAIELQRVQGLADGMMDSRSGRGYQAGFQRGTAAAYHYDDVNAEFNTMLQATS